MKPFSPYDDNDSAQEEEPNVYSLRRDYSVPYTLQQQRKTVDDVKPVYEFSDDEQEISDGGYCFMKFFGGF